MKENKRDLWRIIIQTAISILTAIATTLGVTRLYVSNRPSSVHLIKGMMGGPYFFSTTMQLSPHF